MYITTFYSYKGGVGRTMALANVAAVLSEMGRKVLIVDFDLEAPGVPSYEPFAAALGRPGLVDYIHHYLETNEAPEAADYIVRCEIAKDRAVWVMPAGDNSSPSYAGKFAAIDWQHLYAERRGQDLIDDLRNQWATFERDGFDYVLVDSRTGATDIAGICTRQLPQLVVILFTPTRQNVCGLRPIVDLIRSEHERTGHHVRILFSPSNLPDLFDEDDVLGRALTSAKEQLGFGDRAGLEPAPVSISHWSNMALLDLPVITLARERSKLAKQYRDLTQAIMGENPGDRDGAIHVFGRLPGIFEAAREENRSQVRKDIQDRAQGIMRQHPNDPELAMMAAEIFFEGQSYEEAERYFTVAISQGSEDGRPRLLRAVSRINLDQKDGALEDLEWVLGSPNATTFDLGPAARLLRSASEEPAKIAERLFEGPTTTPRAKIQLAPYLMVSREALGPVADALLAEIDDANMSEDLAADLINAGCLALIGAQRFEDAIRHLERVLAREPDNLAARFNAMMARWGVGGTVDSDEVDYLSAMMGDIATLDPNNQQCFALVAALHGASEDALARVETARDRSRTSFLIFSCWSYLYRTAADFRSDLDAMRSALTTGTELTPSFLLSDNRP
ncbi:KGGVGR-motif variant AAA ATPase [Qipengyuania sediminis]|uniref:KGGVGR-motif variant AAA ATPase n=1 Tax=Qipengyuania sediminis TaxID=1532023 RepID=UPI0010598F15|nr:AAA family ATPase [Qipengyuania sediminis]